MLFWLRRIRKSFTARVIVVLVIATVLTGVVYDLFLIRMQQNIYRRHVLSDGMALATMLARSVRLGMFSEDRSDLASHSDMALNRHDIVGVFLFRSSGSLLFTKVKNSLGGNQNVKCSLLIRDEIQQNGMAFRQTADSFVFWKPVFFDTGELSEENLYFDGQVELSSGNSRVGKEVIGYAALKMSKEMFKKETSRIIRRTAVAGVIFLFISIIAIFSVIRHMTRPLRILRNKIQPHSRLQGNDDIEMLAETYETLLADLEDSFRTISEYRETLEEQVAERTRELEDRSRSLEEANEKLKATLDELAATQEQLIQSEKMAAMGRLVAGVAHEINNTVNFVSGALPSLKRSLAEVRQVVDRYRGLDGKEKEFVAKGLKEIDSLRKSLDFDDGLANIDLLISNMEEGISRTTRIIKDLRVFSHNGKEEFVEADLHTVLDKSLMFLDAGQLENIVIRREYGSIPSVLCQPGRIDQVFLNILTNSIQAMAGGGTVRIRTWADKNHVHVRFTDTGYGIARENLPRIFEPFFTSKRVGEGSGLGLGISYSIVKLHGGEILVESEEGKGAIFEVILPTGEKSPEAVSSDR